jgi:hypothetical protein
MTFGIEQPPNDFYELEITQYASLMEPEPLNGLEKIVPSRESSRGQGRDQGDRMRSIEFRKL